MTTPIALRWVAKWASAGVVLLAFASSTARAQRADADLWRVGRVTVVTGLTGTPVSLRVRAHKLLLDAGVGVREVAPCECLVVSDRIRLAGMPDGWEAVVRVHLFRLANVVTATAVLEVMEGPSRTRDPVVPVGPERAAPLSVGSQQLLDRLQQALQASSFAR